MKLNNDCIIDEIKKMNPKSDDVIIMTFDINEFDFDTIKAYHNGIRKNFNCNFITMPKGLELESCSKDALLSIRNNIDKILEEK